MPSAIHLLSKLWSIYDFEDSELDDFAHQQLVDENRRGLKVMSTLLIFLVLIAMLLFKQLGQLSSHFNLNYFWVMALAAHINISARIVADIKTFHALGITLLVISATAYVFIAHTAGDFSPLLMANIILLFMIIPMIPWGLREASIVVTSIYLLLTLSAWSVTNRFDSDTFLVLQFFLLAAGGISLLLVARSSLIRKEELLMHFELKKAHSELFTLSNIDPLTSAWNRRYTETAIANLINDFKNIHNTFHFIIFDLNDFKTLNDLFGHDFGDRVLILTSQTIIERLGQQGYLIRIGGDEFIIVVTGYNPDQLMQNICNEVSQKVKQLENQANFGFSWGTVTLPLESVQNLEAVYQQADQALYAHKHSHPDRQKRPIDK